MGKKAAVAKAVEGGKKKADKKKEIQLPAPKYGKTDQSAPPTPACALKRSSLKEEDIKALLAANLLQEKDVIN